MGEGDGGVPVTGCSMSSRSTSPLRWAPTLLVACGVFVLASYVQAAPPTGATPSDLIGQWGSPSDRSTYTNRDGEFIIYTWHCAYGRYRKVTWLRRGSGYEVIDTFESDGINCGSVKLKATARERVARKREFCDDTPLACDAYEEMTRINAETRGKPLFVQDRTELLPDGIGMRVWVYLRFSEQDRADRKEQLQRIGSTFWDEVSGDGVRPYLEVVTDAGPGKSLPTARLFADGEILWGADSRRQEPAPPEE